MCTNLAHYLHAPGREPCKYLLEDAGVLRDLPPPPAQKKKKEKEKKIYQNDGMSSGIQERSKLADLFISPKGRPPPLASEGHPRTPCQQPRVPTKLARTRPAGSAIHTSLFNIADNKTAPAR